MFNPTYCYKEGESVELQMTDVRFTHKGNEYRIVLKEHLWHLYCNGQRTDMTNTDAFDLLNYVLNHYIPTAFENMANPSVGGIDFPSRLINEEPVVADRQKSQDEVDAYHQRTNQMQNLVDEACRIAGHEDIPILYSAWTDYADKERCLPLSNLFNVAFYGEYIVRSCPWAWLSNDGTEFVFGPVTNPTWIDLAVLANASIITTGDRHHCYFEGANLNENGDIVLGFGS